MGVKLWAHCEQKTIKERNLEKYPKKWCVCAHVLIYRLQVHMCVQVYVYGCQRLALSIFFNYSLHYLLRKCLSQEPAACWSASLDRDPVSASCAMYDYMIIERLP